VRDKTEGANATYSLSVRVRPATPEASATKTLTAPMAAAET